MYNVFQFEWEVRLIEFIQGFISNNLVLYYLFSFFTSLGEEITTVLIMGLLYWYYDKQKGIKMARNLILGQVSNSMIKNIFSRIRPYAINDSIDCLKVVEPGYDIYDMNKQGFSFPSGHCTNVSTIVFTLYKSFKNKVILSVGLFILMLVGISRFGLGVHYPSDTIMGALLGFITVYLLDYLENKLDKKVLYLLLGVYSLIGIFFCTSNDYYSTLGLYFGFVLGNLFEERYVKFNNTNSIIRGLLRVVVGGLLFVSISYLLKVPFDHDTLEAHSHFAYFYRTFRYAFTSFLVFGVYPMIFKYNLIRFKKK